MVAHSLCRIISVALIVQCFIATSTNAAVHTGHHPSGHKGPRYATTSSAMSVAMAQNEVAAKASKPKPNHNGGGGKHGKPHHNGGGGKHDSGVDGQHPTTVVVSTSKAGKPAAPSPSPPADNSWHAPATQAPTSNSWEGHSTAIDSKTAKASDVKKKTKTKSSSMSLGAKTHKGASTSDSKADKGGETKADKPAPNEYNGVKMVVKAPEGAKKEAKSGKVEGTDDGSWSSGSSTTTTTTSTMPATTTQADIPSVATLPAQTTPPATTTEAVQRAPPAPEKKRDADEDEDAMPTYSPTSLIKERASVEETFTAMEPFGLRFLSSKAQPIFDLDTVTTVTMEHLLHSFRTKGWDVNRLKLMLLDEEDEARIRGLRRKLQGSFPVHELVFGGILYFKTTREMPSEDEMTFITEESFTGDRLSYFVDLLQEKGMDVSSASWGHLATSSEPIQGGSKVNLALILGVTLGTVGLFIACLLSVRLFNKRQRRIEAARSRPSLVFRIKDEVDMVDLNDPHHHEASTIPSTIEDNAASSRYSYYTKQALTSEASDPVSPLETSSDTVSTSTRYVSVFTVKKDCGGKPLEQVDLRKLAVAYLSRLFKKVPHTILLPYDKDSELPAITSIRTIPDDLQELLAYVGQPRIDEYTGKVLFNLRCESDIPMSKMKNLSGQKKQKKSTAASDDYSASSGFEDVTL
jgi:hypothetical protein